MLNRPFVLFLFFAFLTLFFSCSRGKILDKNTPLEEIVEDEQFTLVNPETPAVLPVLDTSYAYLGYFGEKRLFFRLHYSSKHKLEGTYYVIDSVNLYLQPVAFCIITSGGLYKLEEGKNEFYMDAKYQRNKGVVNGAVEKIDKLTKKAAAKLVYFDFRVYREGMDIEEGSVVSDRYKKPLFEVDCQHDVVYGHSVGPWTSLAIPEDMGYAQALLPYVFKASNQKDLKLTMDIYTPRNDSLTKRPLVVLVHGGAFFFGDKHDVEMIAQCTHLASLGYVAVSINYRMGFELSKASIQRCGYKAIQDAHAAMRYLTHHAEEYGIDRQRKDIALTILPHLLRKSHASQNKKIYILTATSGDTGKAALEGFKDSEGTFITVFYPKEGVSLVQERQMNTTEGKNTEVIAVQGNFDDCQRLVKRCYEKISSDRLQLSSANSINIGRLLPQIVYYFKVCAALLKQGSITSKDKVNFIVPSGNFGNILAGYLAKLLGCPIHKLVCASNKNCVLTEFIKTGVYDRNREFYQTISPSMDILVSSNLERLLFLLSHDDEKVSQYMKELEVKGNYKVDGELLESIQEHFEAVFCDEENCKKMIREAYVKEGRLIDSHTAVAYYASKQYGDENINIIVSTASPYKFSNPILEALTGERKENEFDAMRALEKLTGENIPECLRKIERLPVLHKSREATAIRSLCTETKSIEPNRCN